MKIKTLVLLFSLFISVFAESRLEFREFISDSSGDPPAISINQNTSLPENFNIHHFAYSSDKMKNVLSSNLLFILYEPALYLSIVRCERINDEKLYDSTEIPKLKFFEAIDNFGEEFNDYFNKKSFNITFRGLEQKIKYDTNPDYFGLFKCKGVFLDNFTSFNYYKLAETARDNILKTLLTAKNLSFISKFKANEQNAFSAKIMFFETQLIDIYLESQVQETPFDEVSEQVLEFLKDQKAKKVTVSKETITQNRKARADIIYDLKRAKLLTRSDLPRRLGDYQSSYRKYIEGSGLHQKLNIEFQLSSDRSAVSKTLELGGKCRVLFVDFLHDTEYIDYDEMDLNKTLSLSIYHIVDIEKPSENSFQHLYLVEYQIQKNDVQVVIDPITNISSVLLNVKLQYPIHFRYRSPNEGGTPSRSYLNGNPNVYFDCFEERIIDFPPVNNYIDDIVTDRISKVMSRVKNLKTNTSDAIGYDIAVGHMNLQTVVTIITLLVTVCSALFLSVQIFSFPPI